MRGYKKRRGDEKLTPRNSTKMQKQTVDTNSSVQPLIQVTDLRKYFPIKTGPTGKKGIIRAVDGVCFAISEGEALGLVGESGCGKSTLGRTILRLYEPSGGQILFNGIDITLLPERKLRPLRAQMQLIFQDPYSSLNPRQSAREILSLPLRLHFQMTEKKREQQVKELMKQVGLSPDWKEYYPHQFSGGQRQRLGIARALAVNPRFIVADEPVAALDVSIQAQIINLLKHLKKELRLTYLFIAHDLAVISQISERIAVMYLGKIVEKGSRDQIINSPQHPYTQILLDSVLKTSGQKNIKKQLLAGEVPSALNPPPGCRFHPRCPLSIMDVCKEVEPEMSDLGEGQFASCHLLRQDTKKYD
jgi:oligopeptide/dipeptide ABC transporter ATP-binding protein